jgi:Zn-dependent protease with chaperone function
LILPTIQSFSAIQKTNNVFPHLTMIAPTAGRSAQTTASPTTTNSKPTKEVNMTLEELIAEREMLMQFWHGMKAAGRLGAGELAFNWHPSMDDRLDELDKLIDEAQNTQQLA